MQRTIDIILFGNAEYVVSKFQREREDFGTVRVYCPFLHEKWVLLLRLSAKDCLLSVGNGCSNSCPTNGPRESPVARSEPMQTKMIGREAVWICCSRSVKLSVKLDIERGVIGLKY